MVTGNNLLKSLILVRGAPDSGKTTIARSILSGDQIGIGKITKAFFESDFWFSRTGTYQYDPSNVGEADGWCLKQCESAMVANTNLIVIANDFILLWQLELYHKLAEEYGYSVQEIICSGQFTKNKRKLSDEQIARARRNFQYRPRTYTLGSGDEG